MWTERPPPVVKFRYGLTVTVALRILLQRILAHLPAHAGLLEAAEGRRGIEDIKTVDPDRTRADIVCNRMRLTNVSRPNRSRQPIGGVVRPLNHLVEISEPDDAHDRSENLFPGDLEQVLHVVNTVGSIK